MVKLKQLIIMMCLKIVDKLMDESVIVKADPWLDELVDELVEGVDILPSNEVDTTGKKPKCLHCDESYEENRYHRYCGCCGRAFDC